MKILVYKILIVKSLYGPNDKTINRQHMELFKSVSKASERLNFTLFIINWYANRLVIF